MLHFFKTFRSQDDGAVTVDWVVLTAAIVGLAVGIVGTIASTAADKSSDIGSYLSEMEPMEH